MTDGDRDDYISRMEEGGKRALFTGCPYCGRGPIVVWLAVNAIEPVSKECPFCGRTFSQTEDEILYSHCNYDEEEKKDDMMKPEVVLRLELEYPVEVIWMYDPKHPIGLRVGDQLVTLTAGLFPGEPDQIRPLIAALTQLSNSAGPGD